MLGNGVCEELCNVMSCNYDQYDCICSSGCYPEDFGSCKMECLTMACNGDGYGRSGGCTDKFAFTSSLYASIIFNSVTAIFNSHEDCEVPHSCSLSTLKQSYQSGECADVCNSMSCLFSMGTCLSQPITNCLKSYGTEPGNCLQCVKELKQYLGYCIDSCPRGYEELAVMAGVCRDKVNSDSIVDEIYVYEGDQTMKGDGSFDSPYYSLIIALAAAWRKRTVLYILGEKVELSVQSVKISRDNELLHHSNALDLLRDSKCQDLIIRSLTCSNTNHTRCSTTPAEFEMIEAITFNATGKRLTFENIVFSAGCTRADSGKACYSHFSLNLIQAGASSVVTITVNARQAVSFKDIKVKSILAITFGSVSLTNVNFTNIEACSNAKSCGIILQTEECESFNYCGALIYTKGIVTQTNSAHTLNEETSPFLNLNYMTNISIVGVTFSYNLIATSSANLGLIFLNEFLSVRLTNCVFVNNGSTKSLIMIDSSVLIPRTADNTNTATLLSQPHIVFDSLKLMNNFAYKSLMYVGMNNDVLNVVISSCEFENSNSGEYAVTIEFIGNFPLKRIEGHFQSVFNPKTSTTKEIFISKSTIDIIDSTFSRHGSFSAIIKARNCANLNISNVTITNSGNNKNINLMESAIERFLTSAEIDCSVIPIYGADVRCSALILIELLQKLSVSRLTSTGNICTTGGTALSLLDASGAIHSFFASNNIAGKLSSAVLYVSDNSIITAVNLTAINNSGSGKGAVCVIGETMAELSISGSTFQGNTASTGSALYAEGSVQITVKLTVFSGNRVQSSGGGAVFFSSAHIHTSISLDNCRFEGNKALRGGALYISSEVSDLETLLTISSCRFFGNSASDDGASIYLDSKLSLNSTSLISNCQFTDESSPGAPVSLFFRQGCLRIEGSSFFNNSGSTASCVIVQTAPSANTVISGVVFDSNTGAPPIAKPNFRIQTQFSTDHCLFRNHNNAAMLLEGGLWSDSDSVILLSRDSAVGMFNWVTASCLRTAFLNNSSPFEGGAVYLASGSEFNCCQCRFEGNTAKMYGGAVFAEQGAFMKLKACRFERNTADRGSAIYLQSDNGNYTVVTDSLFRFNEAETSGTIFLQSVTFLLSFTTFDSNIAAKTPGITGIYSTMSITDSVFRNQKGSETAFLSLLASMKVKIERSTFENGSGEISGCMNMVSSELIIINSSFTNLTGSESGVVYATIESFINFLNTTVTFVSSKSAGSVIFAADSSVFIYDCIFLKYQAVAITGVNVYKLQIMDSQVLEGNSTDVGAMSCVDCSIIEITDSIFARHQSVLGVLMIVSRQTSGTVSNVTISNTRIEDTRSVETGGISISDSNLNMWSCHFENNSAIGVVSAGGGMMLNCSADAECNYTITDSVFIENSAKKMGGGIYWSRSQPILNSVTFINNTAPYGAKVGSFPVKLGVDITFSGSEYRILNGSILAAPGQTLKATITVSLLDHYGEVVSNDNSSIAEFAIIGTSATASGATKLPAVNGVFIFNDILMYADQNSHVSAEITTSAIDLPSDAISFYMRDCNPGESKAPKSCLICAEHTFSFDPSIPCQQCLAHTQCLGNFTVLPDSGYWRPGMLSKLVFECPQKSACRGGVLIGNGSISYEGFCEQGYKSNMCQSCDIGYSRTSENKCGKCPSRGVNIVRILFVAVGVFLINAVLLLSSLKSALQPKALHSIYFKIMANYWQLVFLITEFKLKWPNAVLQLFNAQQNVGGAVEQIYSIECLLADNGDPSDIYYSKMIYIAVLPVFILIVAALYWATAALIYRKPIYLQRELLATIVIAFFIVHPTLMKTLFTLFSCTEIKDKEYWLTTDMAIRCGNAEHVFYAMIVGLPAIVVWVIGVPLVCLGILIKYRRRHSEAWIRLQYGFLFTGYRPSRFYWEFVILGRKLGVICCFVFVNNSVLIQALSLQLVLILVFYLQYEVRPYTTNVLNRMEMLAIMMADVTIYSGLYYLTEDLAEGGSWFFFAVIVLVNAVFLIYWGVITSMELTEVVARAIPSIGIRLFPSLFERDADIEDFVLNVDSSKDYSDFSIDDMKSAFNLVLAKNSITSNGDLRNPYPREIMDNQA